jgi:acyl phosphate:glycerol-3-phosphate acyltransferase
MPYNQPAVTFALIVATGYLLGSCPWGYWLVRIFHGEDIRAHGSGAIGATNVWRTYGRRLGLAVVALDVAKGFAPAFWGVHAVSSLCGILAGAAAMAGHARPIFLRFEKGGKMVATAGGVVIAVAPLVAPVGAGIWIATFALSRYASLSSILAAISLPFTAYLLGYDAAVIAFMSLAAVAIIWLHRANLRRLRAGTENRFNLRRAAASS